MPITDCVSDQGTVGEHLGSVSLGASGRWCRTGLGLSHLRVRKVEFLSTSCCLSLVEAVPGHH